MNTYTLVSKSPGHFLQARKSPTAVSMQSGLWSSLGWQSFFFQLLFLGTLLCLDHP
jgi:hypothetical protein